MRRIILTLDLVFSETFLVDIIEIFCSVDFSGILILFECSNLFQLLSLYLKY